MEACALPTPAGAPASGAGAASTVAVPAGGPLPHYIASTGGRQPDFHSPDPRITDGSISFPKAPFKSWTGAAPGAGGTLNVFMAGYYPPPTPHDQNATW